MAMKEHTIDLEENKNTYEKKMWRQMKDIESKIKALEKIAHKRDAEENSNVRRELQDARMKFDEFQKKYDGLKTEAGESWPEGSRDVSGAYKQLQDVVDSLETRVKPNRSPKDVLSLAPPRSWSTSAGPPVR